MGVAAGPNVVEDGLVLALDAGNTKSYTGSGTTWTDTVGSNNGTLTNGPTFSRDNGGAFEFDGTDDYIQVATNSNLTFTGDFTYETWLRTDVQTGSKHVWKLTNASLQFTNNFSPDQLAYYSSATGTISFGILNNDVWGHVVITKSSNTVTGYLNGSQAWTNTPGSSDTHDFSGVRIGSRHTESGYYWDGRMSVIRIYNKGLTASEVLQNYNATKNRYNFVWSLPETTTGTIFDFTGGSLPSGMYQDSDGPTVTWGASSVELAGNAPNDGASYPLRVATSFTGDYLFQLSTRIDENPSGSNHCSDAGIGLFNTAYNTSDWTWKWGVLSGRIAAQNNCDTPQLYGHTNETSMSSPNSGDVLEPPYVANQGWVTMHLYHEPSQNRTRYKVTLGEKDWDASGTQIGNAPNSGVLEISDYFSGTYYVGISADDDDDECHMNAFRYVAL